MNESLLPTGSLLYPDRTQRYWRVANSYQNLNSILRGLSRIQTESVNQPGFVHISIGPWYKTGAGQIGSATTRRLGTSPELEPTPSSVPGGFNFFQEWNTFPTDFSGFYSQYSRPLSIDFNRRYFRRFEEVGVNEWMMVATNELEAANSGGLDVPVGVTVYDDEADYWKGDRPASITPAFPSLFFRPNQFSQSNASRSYGKLLGYDTDSIAETFVIPAPSPSFARKRKVWFENFSVEMEISLARIAPTFPASQDISNLVTEFTRYDRWGKYESNDIDELDGSPWVGLSLNRPFGFNAPAFGFYDGGRSCPVMMQWRVLGRGVRYRVTWSIYKGLWENGEEILVSTSSQEVMDGIYSDPVTIDNIGIPVIDESPGTHERLWLASPDIEEWNGEEYVSIAMDDGDGSLIFTQTYQFLMRFRGISATSNFTSAPQVGENDRGSATSALSRLIDGSFPFHSSLLETNHGEASTRTAGFFESTQVLDAYGNASEPDIVEGAGFRESGRGKAQGTFSIVDNLGTIGTINATYEFVGLVGTNSMELRITGNVEPFDFTGVLPWPDTETLQIVPSSITRT